MQKTSTVTVPFMLLGILFNICLVASNLLETKVVQVSGITATAGLIVFPISYIINDCIAEVWGFKKARLIIWSGFASNFLVIGFADFDSDFISMIFEYIETHFADSHIVVFYDESSSCFIAVVGNLFFNFRCACPKPVWKSGVGHDG